MNRFVNQSKFAEIIGVDRSYVTKLKKHDRLVIDDDGLIDVDASVQRIKDTADPNRGDVVTRWKNERGDQAPVVSQDQSPELSPELPEDSAPEDHSYQRARAKKEHFLAERARIDYLREIGELVPILDMRQAVADVITTFRQTLEQLPYRTGPELVGTDLDAIRATLKQDIHAALSGMEREFSKRLESNMENV